MNTRLLVVHALSPLHAGTGQSFGAIDLAIARDRATDHPYLPGSSLKGSLRATAFARADLTPQAPARQRHSTDPTGRKRPITPVHWPLGMRTLCCSRFAPCGGRLHG